MWPTKLIIFESKILWRILTKRRREVWVQAKSNFPNDRKGRDGLDCDYEPVECRLPIYYVACEQFQRIGTRDVPT